MFGLGKDDKNQLEENMKEIKQMIERGENTGESPDEQENRIDEMEKELRNEEWRNPGEQEEESGEQTAEFGEPGAPGQESPIETEPDRGEFDQEFSQQVEEAKKHEEKAPETNLPKRESSGTERKDEKGGESRLDEQIPEPPETKQLNVPDIDKGPLFIRRQKFRSAREMIQEMRYLSQEIEEVINQLERGIEQDRKTEREAKELLHKMEEDRNGVKDIISPESE